MGQGDAASDKPLPLLEPALVLGVSNADLLKQACGEYRSILNEALKKMREQSGEDFPNYQVPQPESKQVQSGVLYYFPVPKELGLDPQISPNAGLSASTAVLALSHAQTERLLA